jgi:hypothetical protein
MARPVMAGSKWWIHTGRAKTGWGLAGVCKSRKVLVGFEGILDRSGKGWSGFEGGLRELSSSCGLRIGLRSAGAQVAMCLFLLSIANPAITTFFTPLQSVAARQTRLKSRAGITGPAMKLANCAVDR